MLNEEFIMRKIVTLLLFAFCTTVLADHDNVSQLHYLRNELQKIIDINIEYQQKFNELVSDQTLKQQVPDATIVLCSDSRVDMNSINSTPAGQLFTVRNIGNQVQTAYGSVEYGVEYLHTPMLIIVGHSGCGAVKAAMHDFGEKSKHLQRELGFLKVNPKMSLTENIVKNVNNQVKLAIDDFRDLVKNGKLLVIGLVYDLHNDFKLGQGKIILVNINNETSPEALANNPYVKGLKNLTLLKGQ